MGQDIVPGGSDYFYKFIGGGVRLVKQLLEENGFKDVLIEVVRPSCAFRRVAAPATCGRFTGRHAQ